MISPTDVTPETAAQPALRSDTLAASVLILFAITLLQRGVGFGRSVLVCRWLDADQLGRWDLAFGFLMLAAPVLVLGVPGSFGRYVEHFRRLGQLRVFLLRATVFTTCAIAIGVSGLLWKAEWFSSVVFGDTASVELIACLAFCLASVVWQNYLVSLFTALRLYRIVSSIQFANTVLFATLTIALLCFWRQDAAAVILGYGAASLLSSLGALPWVRGAWREAGAGAQAISQRAFWAKLLPFAVWLWATNWLTNLFELTDRYMLIHYSGLSADEALAQVGQYHSARLIPLLFVGLAELMAALVTPHLSHDWELGRHDEVGRRLNLILKVFAFVMTSGATAVLLLAPWLFGAALGGKFSAGLAVLPMTLCYCLWGAQSSVAQNYLWCAEKARLASASLLVGLIVNIGLNLWWLPKWGLHGAVAATMLGTATALTLVLAANRALGMKFDRGVAIASMLPALVCLGPIVATLTLVTIGAVALTTNLLLTRSEQQTVTAALLGYLRTAALAGAAVRRFVPQLARKQAAH
ncbi:MAG: lipopolysaccharide biosynthesis protein [Planctomycetia bacterium]|nr:lipopolysaccharide biosynthesis protein [Planctomycetia bacterium]